jgi:hypothetical protein
MSGQGRPHCCWLFGQIWAIALALCAVSGATRSLSAEQFDIRVRIAWGGGDARPWQGTIRLSEGTLSDATPLGLEADAPGSMLLEDNGSLRIYPRTPRTYDGCDLRIQAPAGAKLVVDLSADSTTAASAPLELPLSKLVRDFLQIDLDDRGNRLLAQRSPGDGLRVSFAQQSLIFSPGERFELEVQPQHLDVTASGSYLLMASLGPARTDDQVWHEDHEWKIDATGAAPKSIPLAVKLPEQEGAYDLRLSLYPKRLTSNLVRGKAIATRKVQLVVVAPVKNIPSSTIAWQSILEFDPATPKWWERMARLPSWTRLPSVPRPVESGPATTRTHLGRPWVELAPHAWQAYPLSINVPGAPHILEVEYPSDIEQTLAISLVEPGAGGTVGPIGVDSGIDVPRPEPGHQATARRHRLVIWPQTRTPYLLLVNRRDDMPAVFGKIDVQAGPPTLPPLAIPASTAPTRTLAAYYDKPLIAENFSASESVDPVSHRGLDDWLTFGFACERLIQVLQRGGYNAVVITAACEGSAIYPSKVLQPTPKYDSGAFFESGQDPIRKDVLELLFRLCDRSGLVCVPAVQFAGPLPELEAIRQGGGNEAAGLEPLGPDGRTWMGRTGGQAASGVYYNALDERVQRAMIAVVGELAERYGRHASFGGVAVQLSPESYSVLPDETCSLDDITFGKFLADTKLQLPASIEPLHVARWNYLRQPGPDRTWLAWRAAKMAAFYRQMRGEIDRHRNGAKLYLTTANLLSGRELQTVLRPELPPKNNVAELLPLLGLDLSALDDEGIVVPRPQRIVAATPPQQHDQQQHWNRHPEVDALFQRASGSSSLHFLTPSSQRLPDFDAVSPFGPDKTHTLLVSQVVPADAAYRERFVQSLARLDALTMIDGGWLLPLGQEAALAPLAKVYRRLPAERFLAPARSGQSEELVVRTLPKGSKTYFYAVNPTPWPLTAHIEFASSAPIRLMSYADERQAKLQSTEAGAIWSVEMEPFDLVGGEIADGKVSVVSTTITPPPSVAPSLGQRSRQVLTLADSLHDNPRRVAILNASFEMPARDGAIPGWLHASDPVKLHPSDPPKMTVRVDPTQGSNSRSSLHLANRTGGDPLWVRSEPFASPQTGRLQLKAWIRVADAARQPQLRLAIEGRLDGQVYYRRLTFGAKERETDQPPTPLTTEWKEYTFSRINLPISGLTELRVGFDQMSDGEVWIDDVRVYDLWLQEAEHDELKKSVPTARFQADSGRLNECRLFVEGYWPSFLRRNVELPDSRELPPVSAGATAVKDPPAVAAGPKSAAQPPAAAPPPPSRRFLPRADRKSWWPSWPWK